MSFSGSLIQNAIYIAQEPPEWFSESFLDIRLAVVTRVHQHWITVDVLRVSPDDRMRLKRFTISMQDPAYIDHLLIRA